MRTSIWAVALCATAAAMACGSSDDEASSTSGASDGAGAGGDFMLAPPPLDNQGTPSQWLGVDDRKQLSTLDADDLTTACNQLRAMLAAAPNDASLRTQCTFDAVYFLEQMPLADTGSIPMDGAAIDGGVMDGGAATDAGTPGAAGLDLEACEAEAASCIADGGWFNPGDFAGFCKPALQACNRPAADFDACRASLEQSTVEAAKHLSCANVLDETSPFWAAANQTDIVCDAMFSQCRDLSAFLF